MIYRWLIAYFLFATTQLLGQYEFEFVYKSMDAQLIDIWMSSNEDSEYLPQQLSSLKRQWSEDRIAIYNLDIEHFDNPGFVEDQDLRLNLMQRLLDSKKYFKVRNEAYIMLNEMRDVRACFTADEYQLDLLLDAFDTYLSVHKIIHDPMMGLYEWTEFIWYVDQLKCKVELLESAFDTPDAPQKSRNLKDALDRVIVCLETLDQSLGDAYRPDFEVPCNELNISLRQLVQVYNDGLKQEVSFE